MATLRPNMVFAKGYVMNEPVAKQLESGNSIISVVVATTDYYKNDKDEYVNITHPLDFTTFFEAQIKYIGEHIKQGDYVEVFGNVVQLKKEVVVDGKKVNRYKYALTLREINKLFSGDKIKKSEGNSAFAKENKAKAETHQSLDNLPWDMEV